MDGLDELLRDLQSPSTAPGGPVSRSDPSRRSQRGREPSARSEGPQCAVRHSNLAQDRSSSAIRASEDDVNRTNNDDWDWGDDDGGGGVGGGRDVPTPSSEGVEPRRERKKSSILSIRRPDPKALSEPDRARSEIAVTAADVDPWDDWCDEEGEGGQEPRGLVINGPVAQLSVEEEQAVVETEALVREMLQDIVDEDARSRLNASLERDFKFDAFVEYYISRPDLAEYTIKHELDRMDYTVICSGASTSDKLMILSIYQRSVLNDLWRMANQSVYADLVSHLQRAYLSPDVALGVQTTTSSFIIDLDLQTLRAEGHFIFTAPTSLEAGSKRELGGVVGTVEVDLLHRSARAWIGTPSLRVVFDSDLRLIALCSVKLLREDDSDANSRLIDPQRIREVASGAASVAVAATSSVQAAGLGLFASALRSLQDIQTRLEAPPVGDAPQEPRSPTSLGQRTGGDTVVDVGVEDVMLKTGAALKRSSAGFMLGIVGTVGRLLGADEDIAASQDATLGPGNLFPRRPSADGMSANIQSAKAGALLAEALRSRGDCRYGEGDG